MWLHYIDRRKCFLHLYCRWVLKICYIKIKITKISKNRIHYEIIYSVVNLFAKLYDYTLNLLQDITI